MNVSSSGNPNITPPAPRRTIRRFTLSAFEASFFMALFIQGRRFKNASLVTRVSAKSCRETMPARDSLAR